MNFKIKITSYHIRKFRILLFIPGFCFIFAIKVSAQEKLYPLFENTVLQDLHQPAHKTPSQHSKTTKILQLPFFDDFSTNTGYPNDTLWMDNFVFINTGFPVKPPSLGVATFDGLNSYGHAYDPGNQYASGSADTLTSAYIDLSNLQAKDSVALSFYYQPTGLGESPDFGDSLIVEFKPDHIPGFDTLGNPILDTVSWIKVWSKEGSGVVPFKRVFIPVSAIADSNFFHSKFQFRFRNIANRSGNLDIWNVDYVYLDRGRKTVDTFSQDVAIFQPSKGIVNGYTAIPWTHFIFDTAGNYRKSLDVYAHNNSNATRHTTFNYIIYSETEHNVLASTVSASQAANINANEFLDFNMPTRPLSSLIVNNLDSVVLSIQTIAKSDVAEAVKFRPNDTAKRIQVFNNYYAYDDGTAETGYGITASPNGSEVAMKFRFIKTDTLFGVGIHFNQSMFDVSQQFVKLLVWKKINENNSSGNKDVISARLINILPDYSYKQNGFAYYALDTPIVVSDSVYIGWAQSTDFNLNVGFDRNYSQIKKPGSKNLFYNIDGIWYASKQNGIPMIRAYVGKRPVFPSAIKSAKNTINLTADIFPNPCHGFFNLLLTDKNLFDIRLTDIDGKQLMHFQNVSGNFLVDATALKPGIYICHIQSMNTSAGMLIRKIVVY